MGKSYVENSLKRFLKRKVKITMGVVVTFLITGAVSFGANDYPLMNDEIGNSGYINAMESLSGLGSDKAVIEKNTHKVTGNDGDKEIKIEKDNEIVKIDLSAFGTKSTSVSFNNKFVSETVKNNIDNAFGKGYIINTIGDSARVVEDNFGILGTLNNSSGDFGGVSQVTSETVKEVTNNGILLTGQGAASGGKAYNNGLIVNFVLGGQWGHEGKGIELYNNGLIVSDKAGQYFHTATESYAVNYGVIVAKGEGQHGAGNTIYNYGIIEAGTHGQTLNSAAIMKNYGTINATEDNAEGQSTTGTSSNRVNSKAYNYGLIKVVNGYGMNTKGEKYNYGVIHSSGQSNVFGKIDGLGEIVNKGIVITGADVYSKDWAKTGVTLNGKYELQNKDTAVVITGNLDNSSFREGENKKNIGYIHTNDRTSSLGISNITADRDEKGDIVNRKVLGVVAEQNSTVFTAKENLLLDGIDMTGYLINGGTFINMNDKDLVLSDVNITVTEDLTKTNGKKAVAVDLGAGKLSLIGTNTINGIIKGGEGSKLEALAQKNKNLEVDTEGEVVFKNAAVKDFPNINFTNVTLTGTKAGSIKSEFTHTSDGKENTITIGEKFVVGDGKGDYTSKDVIVDKSLAGNKVNYIIENLDNIHGNIKLGAGENTVTVTDSKFKNYNGTIDLGSGDSDKFVAEGTGNSVFNYHVQNAETIELNGGTWGDWTNAQGTISFDKITKAENYPKLTLGEKETKINITLGTEDNGSDFAEYIAGLGEALGTNHLVIHGTGQDVSTAKYLIGADGVNFDNLSTTRYSFDDKVNYKDSPIFNISSDEGKGVNISVKTAGEMGLSGQHRIIYEAYLNEIKADGSANKEVIDQINGYNTSEDFANHIKQTNVTGEAYYTAGSVVTMDIADTYLSAVEDFTKRAGKGEWLAQGKYINSDTEFDGGSKVKGYDGDVTGTMGMIEYGFTENTSYGIVYGQGDSEMDIDGGGKLDGDNIYAGLYMKHRTQNGIELVANLGYVENDMDSVLKNNFRVDGISGNTFEKGTADSSAVILSVKGKKDYRITDTVKVQPILGARATFINQEEAENPEMHFTIKEQDIIVVEGTAGMGIAKEFALPQGKLELNAGVEYTFAATSSTNDAEYTLFDETTVKLEEVDTAENTGTAFAGFDYEHESGVGFNGKYEMMWSDKGDDSRITAGISYRF